MILGLGYSCMLAACWLMPHRATVLPCHGVTAPAFDLGRCQAKVDHFDGRLHITHHTLCLSLFHSESIRTLHHLYITLHHFTGVPIVLDLDLCPSSTCFFPSGPSVSFWKFLWQFGCAIASKVHLDPCFGARNSLV